MSVRASPLDKQSLWLDEKCVIAFRLYSVVSPGCFSAVALLIFLICAKMYALLLVPQTAHESHPQKHQTHLPNPHPQQSTRSLDGHMWLAIG